MTGPGAVALLQRLCVNRVDKGVGSITYTSMLNRRGGIECDVTVTRLGAEHFLIVTGTAFGRHDRSWIEQHAPSRRCRWRYATSPARWRASGCGARRHAGS